MARSPQFESAESGTEKLFAAAPPRLFVGTSGWAYPSWKPEFYPSGLSAKKLLSFYASKLNSVEVNHTFRKLPTEKAVAEWLAATPAGFRFSFKAPQRVTHFKRLVDCEEHLAEFIRPLAPVVEAGKLGLLLFQLPPNFKADPERLKSFLAALRAISSLPVSFEFRHDSWFAPEIERILREHDAAFCIAESDGFATPEVHTAQTHTSFRLRRNGGYKPDELQSFAERFLALSTTRDVYVYLKHEDEPTGAINGVDLLRCALKTAGAAQ